MRLSHFWSALAMAAGVFLLGTRSAGANEEPYCGLYSMHAALHSLGIPVHNFDEMVSPEYLSGTQGSTALDLLNLAKKYGAVASFAPRMTLADLRQSPSPVILHTSVAMSNSGFHHWILFLGMIDGSAKLYDPPRGVYEVPSAELLSYWDGSGVIVARSSNESALPTINYDLVLAFLAVLVVGSIVNVITALSRRPVRAIVLVATVSGVAWHAIVGYGFFGNQHAIANVSAEYMDDATPIITTETLLSPQGDEGVTIIDARRPDAYERMHIPNAINIPITATHGLLRDAFSAIPTDNHIIVYCQSQTCDWSDAVALQFRANGYRRVSIYRDGFAAWKAATKRSQ